MQSLVGFLHRFLELIWSSWISVPTLKGLVPNILWQEIKGVLHHSASTKSYPIMQLQIYDTFTMKRHLTWPNVGNYCYTLQRSHSFVSTRLHLPADHCSQFLCFLNSILLKIIFLFSRGNHQVPRYVSYFPRVFDFAKSLIKKIFM